MKVRVLFFGPAKTATGADHWIAELSAPANVAELAAQLSSRFPALARMIPSLRFAVNETFVTSGHSLNENDEVAVIPPVSGGANADRLRDPVRRIELVSEPLDVGAALAAIEGDPHFGGVCSFSGLTRRDRHPEHGELRYLEYQVYESMAIKQLRALADEVSLRWPVGPLVFLHRVGRVELGQASVFIAVGCAHRAEAFEACRWLIERLKKEVPIWKREVWADGASTWVDPTKASQEDSQGISSLDG